MLTASLDRLPSELLFGIATQCDALSALHLSATCRRVRSACHSAVLFKTILSNSQRDRWEHDSLDIQSVGRRCGNDASVWARYAIADEDAYLFSQYVAKMQVDLEQGIRTKSRTLYNEPLKATRGWSAELMVVRHPFMYCWLWAGAVTPHVDQIWCAVVASLAQRSLAEPSLAVGDSVPFQEAMIVRQSSAYPEVPLGCCLLALRVTINKISEGLALFNRTIRDLPLPRLSELQTYLSGPDPSNPLPLPFAGGWDRWYRRHNRNLVEHLTTGVWQGYYLFSVDLYEQRGAAPVSLDPPMRNIRFRKVADDGEGGQNSSGDRGRRVVKLLAENCSDEVGGFAVTGTITEGREDEPGSAPIFHARKQYNARPHRSSFGWDWELRATEFGLVGFWGSGFGQGITNVHGTVWLWKAASEET